MLSHSKNDVIKSFENLTKLCPNVSYKIKM